MSNLIHRLWSEDAGQDIAEYAVMLAVILVSGGGDGTFDRIECQYRIFKCRQFDPVTKPSNPTQLSSSDSQSKRDLMTRFSPGTAFTAYFWFTGSSGCGAAWSEVEPLMAD